jgi:hypothetical protein
LPHDVFISYSAQDKTVADALCATLENRKIQCWIAPRDILPGEDFASAITKAIENSRIFLLVFSKDSNTSQYVMREVNAAVSRGNPIIPFRIEDVKPTQSMAFLLGTKQWLDALTPPLERHLQKLADIIQILLANKEEHPTSTPLKKETHETRTKRQSHSSIQKTKLKFKQMRIIAALALIVLIVMSVFFFSGWFFEPNKPETTPTPSFSVNTTPSASVVSPIVSPSSSQSSLVVNASGQEGLDFVPKGVAIVELNDSSEFSVPANCLVFDNYGQIIAGLPYNIDQKIVLFTEMKSFKYINSTTVMAVMNDGSSKTLTASSYEYFEGLIAPTNVGTQIWRLPYVRQVTFDHDGQWQGVIPMANITTYSGDFFRAPAGIIIWDSLGVTRLGIVSIFGNFVPFNEIAHIDFSIGNSNRGLGNASFTTNNGEVFEITLEYEPNIPYICGLNKLGLFQISVSDLKSIDFNWSP